VTEIVLGLDLVAEQLKIAAGEGLSFAQKDLKQSGHAVEVRVCAERPERDFQPATGRVGLLRVPAGPGVRWDGGISEGQAVTPAFDSMLAKLIAGGATRAEAIDRMAGALKELVILGVPTNVDFLARIMANPTFRSGTLDTGFIAREAARLAAPAPSAGEGAAAILAALSGNVDFRLAAYEVPEPYASIGAWHN
jgi:propionyl-CoA carboxylase alpha chain/3-methylcrotonyl-CoA carboxylase alpha subunit/acetyl-CoA/propionyl-CoA carboxylase biotin carboxyl carrier protein